MEMMMGDEADAMEDWEMSIQGEEDFAAKGRAARAPTETDRLRAALREIAAIKSEPIGNTGFVVGPASLLAACQRIARKALIQAR